MATSQAEPAPVGPRSVLAAIGSSNGAWWRFLTVVSLTLLFPVTWAVLAYRGSHLESQGIDIVHHAIMVRQLTVPGGTKALREERLDAYPHLSHQLPALLSWMLGGRIVLSLRAASLISIATLFVLQYGILRRWMAPVPAAIALFLTQALCLLGKVANASHFMDGAYNYSRAVAGVGLWSALYLLANGTPQPRTRLLRDGAASICAALALGCHVAPGGIAFFGVFLTLLLRWRHTHERSVFGSLVIATVILGLTLMLTSGWKIMIGSAGGDGWMPLAHLPLLLAWVPVALVAAWRQVSAPLMHPDASATRETESALSAFLLAACTLQTYAAIRLAQGSIAPYAVKSLFYYTFPLALLLLTFWVDRGMQHMGVNFARTKNVHRRWCVVLAAVLAIWVVGRPLARDPGLSRKTVAADESQIQRGPRTVPYAHFQAPDEADALLRARQGIRTGVVYLDPQCPFGAYFVSLSALGQGIHPDDLIHGRRPDPEKLFSRPDIDEVLLPADVDPVAYLGMSVVVRSNPPWICCDLRSARLAQERTARHR